MQNHRVVSAIVLSLLAGVAPALAQNALGTGRGLERDLRVGGRGNAPRANMAEEIRLRNAVVTGNVGGGLSFRGNAGYRAPGEFGDTLASDSTFQFRRDSYSAGMAYRGTDSIRFQYSQTTGNNRAGNPNALPGYSAVRVLDRDGTVSAQAASPVARVGNDLSRQPLARRQPGDDFAGAARADGLAVTDASPLSARLGTMRSTAAFTANSALEPGVVGMNTTEGNARAVTASSLLGLRGLKETRTIREAAEIERNRNPLTASAAGGSASRAVESMAIDNSARFRTAYEDVQERMEKAADRAGRDGSNEGANDGANRPRSLQERMDLVRQRLQGRQEPMDPSRGDDTENRGTGQGDLGQDNQNNQDGSGEQTTPQRKPTDRRTDEKSSDRGGDGRSGQAAGQRDGRGGPTRAGRPRMNLDADTMRLIREGGGEVSTYTTGNPGDLFGLHVQKGQEMLARNRYFDAEEHFARALAMKPGDVTTMAARIHAQVGAGLFVSAAVNLRQLYNEHPEVMGVRFAGQTLPNQERLKALMGELRQNIATSRGKGLNLPQESAFLLGYLGFQTMTPEAVSEGLAVLREADPGDGLPDVLEAVWKPVEGGK